MFGYHSSVKYLSSALPRINSFAVSSVVILLRELNKEFGELISYLV
jgi:hypothetical protein